MTAHAGTASHGPLGDSAQRDYGRKLSLFHRFAAPELRQAIETLCLGPGMRVLDAGCGTGETLRQLQLAVEPEGLAVGVDLSAAHLAAARAQTPDGLACVQASLSALPLRAPLFDLVWCANTIHHLDRPLATLQRLHGLLRPGGRIVLAQSALLPDLCFAWDTSLERAVTDAVHRYYQQRYALPDDALRRVRALVGLAHAAQLRDVSVRTLLIERVAPLSPADEQYLTEAIFRDTWGERLRPFLDDAQFAQLARLCDPASPEFALRRADFHYIQSLTLVTGS